MSSLALACRMGAGSPITLPRRVRSILRKYGATMLLPGPAVPILGPELVVGGSFDSAAGWTLFGDSGTISGGVANLTRTSAYTIFERTIQVEANKTYLVSFESRRASGTGIPVFQLRTASNTAGSVVAAASNASPTSQFATNSVNYTAASSATLYVQAGIGTAAAEVSIDSVSVREIVGYQNTYASFAAGNYRESTGQSLAAVDQQVGLVVNAAQSPGPEIATGNNLSGFSNITAEVSHTDSAFTTTGPTVGVAIPVTVGKYYEVIVAGSTTSEEFSINTYSPVGPARTLVRVGFGRCVVKADFPNIYLRNSTAGVTQITHVSVRELPGIHASQATSGFQPYLRQSGVVNSWQFDGVDDRQSLSAVPFEMADDFFGVFGYRIAAAADVNLLALRNTGQTNPAIVFGVLPNGAPRFWARNDVGTFVQTQGLPRIGVDTVLSGRKYSATMECRVEGALAQAAGRPANALTVNNATLCASVATTTGGFFNGNLHGVILGKGAITEAELLTLEKFIAKLQGRSL